MKRTLATLLLAAATICGLSGVAAAESNNYCGSSSNGCDHSGTLLGSCAGHGSFGAFGKDNSLAGGANGPLTGFNNSHLCGNPQN